jgi:hypothetical protein
LGFPFIVGCLVARERIGQPAPEQQLAPPPKFVRAPLATPFQPKKLVKRTLRKIWSPLSQNAAAMLFDVKDVDIRRVGTHRSEYSSWGVPR